MRCEHTAALPCKVGAQYNWQLMQEPVMLHPWESNTLLCMSATRLQGWYSLCALSMRSVLYL